MELGTAKRPIVFGVDDVTNDVIRSKSRSNFKIAISQPILRYSVETKTEMQRWLWDIILLWLTSGVTSGASGSTLNFDIKMAAIFKIHVAY